MEAVKRYETRDVLAGAYKGRSVSRRTLLSHLADVTLPGDAVGLCGRAPNLVDAGGMTAEGLMARPTCARCGKLWDRLMLAGSVAPAPKSQRAVAEDAGLPWHTKLGWVGGDERTLYAITDKRTGVLFVRPVYRMGGVGPEVEVRVATRAEAEAHWQSPLSSGWTVAPEADPRQPYVAILEAVLALSWVDDEVTTPMEEMRSDLHGPGFAATRSYDLLRNRWPWHVFLFHGESVLERWGTAGSRVEARLSVAREVARAQAEAAGGAS